MGLGQVIRQQREKVGLTLDEVSRKTGYSKPYLSTIETGRVKNPPGDDLLQKLEKILELESGLLLRLAHLEKLPPDMRQAYENSMAENEQLRAMLRQVMKKGANDKKLRQDDKYRETLANCVQKPSLLAGMLIPVINKVSAGYPTDYDDKDYPAGAADDYVRCPDLHDSNAFAVRVFGDSMEPKYREGDIIVFSPTLEVRNGDDCFIRLTNPHETTFKRVYFEKDGTVRLQPRNQNYPPIMLKADRLNGVWRAVIRYERLT